jgi:hypothetical protein
VALPQEVLEAIAAAEGADNITESQSSQTTAPASPWLATLFRRLADFFAKSAKEGKDDDLAYGYPPVADVQPPAYGVPVQVLMDLVRDAHKLLSQIKDSLEGEEKEQVEALLDRIEQAFGTAAQKTDGSSQSACDAVPQDSESVNDSATFWTEFRLAVKATAPTQPVLAPLEAADQLQKAWQSVAELALTSTLNEGDVFSAFFALRTAVDAAVRTLRATAVNTGEPTESHDDSEMASTDGQDRSDTVSDAATEHPVALLQDDEMTAQGATTQQSTEPQSADSDLQALVGQAVAAALEPFVAELKALQETVQTLQERIEKRRRVTQAVASSAPANGANDPKDIMARWMAAKTDAERRRLLREAQKLLAAPIPVGEAE